MRTSLKIDFGLAGYVPVPAEARDEVDAESISHAPSNLLSTDIGVTIPIPKWVVFEND